MIEKRYEIRNLVGTGNFSKVYLAMDKKTYKNVAIKVMKTHECIAYKQACILKRFNHPNIASLIDFQQDIKQKSSKLVIEYLPKNALELYQENKNGLSEEQIKCILFQTALGLAYVHSKGYIHRDIKPQNILINKDTAQVKIIDFGLAVSGQSINTDYVATRWYRAPQNLLTTRQYTCAIDVFSLGCVIVQMYLGQPMFPGIDNIDQINLIHKVFGQPTKQNWKKGYENLQKLKLKNNLKINQKQNNKYISNIFKSCSSKLINIIERMLIMNPKNRISCRQIIMDSYFNNIKEIIPKNIYERYKNDNNKNNKIKYSQRYKSYNNIYQAIQYQQQSNNNKNKNKQIILEIANNYQKIKNKNHKNNHYQQQKISIINKQYQGKTNRLQQSKSLQQININSKCKADSYHHYSIHNSNNNNYMNNSNQNQNNQNNQNNSNDSGQKLTFRRVNQIRKPKIQVNNNKAKYNKFIDKQISLEEKEKNNGGQIKSLRQPFKGIREQNKKYQQDYSKQYKRNIKGQINQYNNKLIKADKDLIANYQNFTTPEILMQSSELSSSQKKIDLKQRKGGQQQMKIDRQVVKISQRYITNNDKNNISNSSNRKINYLPDIKEQQDSKDNNDRLYKGVKVSQGQLGKKQPKLKVTVVKNSMKNYNSPKQSDKYMIRKEHLYKSTDLMKYKKIEQQKKIDDNNNKNNILSSQIDPNYQIDDRHKKSPLIRKQKQIPEMKMNRIKTVKLKKQITDPILINNNTIYGGEQRINTYKNRLTQKFNNSNSNHILPSNININLNLNIIEGKKYTINDNFSHTSPSIYREYNNNKPTMISMNYKSPPTKKSQHLNLHNLELHQRNK